MLRWTSGPQTRSAEALTPCSSRSRWWIVALLTAARVPVHQDLGDIDHVKRPPRHQLPSHLG
jgi:hypothetical protein